MKHFAKMATPIFCALMLFTACDSTEARSGSESRELPSADISSAEVARKDFLLTPPDQVPLDPSTDPPIKVSEIHSVPDFLNEEQQHLYQQAYSIWEMFNGNPVCDLLTTEYEEPIIVENAGSYYIQASGRYQNWKDFNMMIRFVFTNEYAEELIGGNDDPPTFFNKDGILHVIDAAKGSNYGYEPPDTYELVSKNENLIHFKIIGHFKTDSEAWTVAFPASMVLTDDGWRFQEFNSPIYNEYER